MKLKISLVFSLFVLLTGSLFAAETIHAANQTKEQELLAAQIQMLQYEVMRLQGLLSIIQAQSQPYVPVTANSYLAINLSDNSVLAAKNANQPHIVASITKLMNAVIVLEHVKPSDTITLTPAMLAPEGHSPSLYAGLTVSRDNLLHASLIQSTNDAAEALAHFVGRERFVALMNQKAGDLNMNTTVFFDPHGLNPRNTSTAADLAKLTKYIYEEHPEILTITKDNNFWLPNSAGTPLKFRNLNTFSDLAEFVGGKIGWLPESKQTYVSVFQVQGDPVAIIVLGSENREADILKILENLKPKPTF